jgi:hypothetical protein
MKFPLWSAPPIWKGQRCFVLAGGPSLGSQPYQKITGNVLVVKHAALLRPDAEVMLFAGKGWHRDPDGIQSITAFNGKYCISRGWSKDHPAHVLSMGRVKGDAITWAANLSDDPQRLGGWDTGASAINLAYLLGSTEIILLGFDMRGGHWFKDHPAMYPRQSEFARHMLGIAAMADQLAAKGVKVWNCSSKSALTCFDKMPLEDFL